MTTNISFRSDSKSDHNKESKSIKSDVIAESSGISSDVAATTVVGDGPVLSLINKRLRNHCKKLNRILRMKEFLAQGKPINKEQAQLLQSKSVIYALIDELENLNREDDDEVDNQPAAADNSGNASQDVEKELMFRKHLTFLDVNCNHLVIPKQFATKYFLHSCDSGDKGLALRFEDESGNCWLIHCSDRNISQSYLKTEGWRKFIEEKQLAPGDIITFERHRTDGDRFFIGWQRQGSAAASQDGGAAVSGGGNDGSNRGLYQGHPYLEHVQGQGTNVPYQPDCSRAEISLALQCHAISGKSGTCQDQDQEKASEERGFKAHKIDSRSDHNEGSTKIKSSVLVSIDGGVFSSDITDTTLVGGPVLSLIDKRLQNHRKKLNRILQMEEFLAQGKPLNKEQAELLQSKSAVSALIDELEKLRKPLTSAVSEEISPALQSHVISGKNGTCQDEEQEKAFEEKESKSQKELSIDPKSDHDGSTKDVMSTECSGPSQVDQQNEGNALSLSNCDSNTDLKEEDLEEENSLVDQQNEEFSLSPWEAERLGISENDNMEEVDWEKCCRKLRGSNLLLMEMLGLYQDELNVMKDLIREFPEFIEGKPAHTSAVWHY